MVTFHQNVQQAAAFAEKLPKTAAKLHVNDVSDADLAAAEKFPASSIDAEFYEVEASRDVPRTESGCHGCGATTSRPSGAR